MTTTATIDAHTTCPAWCAGHAGENDPAPVLHSSGRIRHSPLTEFLVDRNEGVLEVWVDVSAARLDSRGAERSELVGTPGELVRIALEIIEIAYRAERDYTR